jgi:post-segregation antitoxin (ccd killing protein)
VSVFRREHHDPPFLILDSALLRDVPLSLASRGLHAYMLDKPPDWEFSAERIANDPVVVDGRKAVQAAMRGLRVAGLLRLVRHRDVGGRLRSYLQVRECRDLGWPALPAGHTEVPLGISGERESPGRTEGPLRSVRDGASVGDLLSKDVPRKDVQQGRSSLSSREQVEVVASTHMVTAAQRPASKTSESLIVAFQSIGLRLRQAIAVRAGKAVDEHADRFDDADATKVAEMAKENLDAGINVSDAVEIAVCEFLRIDHSDYWSDDDDEPFSFGSRVIDVGEASDGEARR